MKSRKFLLLFSLLFLFGFWGKGGAISWEDGQFQVNINSKVYYQDIFGNEDRSFLEEGTHYVTELTGDLTQEVAPDKINLNAYFSLKSSDDPQQQIDERDVMFLQGHLRFYNGRYEIHGGDFSESYTSYTLGASLLGVKGMVQPLDGLKVYALWGRNRDEELDRYVRHTLGARVVFSHKGLSLGATFVQHDVERDSLKEDSPLGDEFNQVFGGDMKLDLFGGKVQLEAEYARSLYNPDKREEAYKDERDDAFMVRLHLVPWQRLSLSGEFERVEPLFNSVMGASAADLQRIKGQVEFSPWDFLSLSLMHEYSFDKLTDDSIADYRTHSHMTSAGLTVSPFYKRQDYWNTFTVSLQGDYSDYYARGYVDQEDLRLNLTVSQSFTHWNYSVGYSYSRNWNHIDKSSEMESHSPGLSVGIDYEWLALKWNWSFNLGYEYRKALLEGYVDKVYRGDTALVLNYEKTNSTLSLGFGVEHYDNSDYLGMADNTRYSYALNFDQVLKQTEGFTATLTLSSTYSDYDEDTPDADYAEAIHSLSLKVNF